MAKRKRSIAPLKGGLKPLKQAASKAPPQKKSNVASLSKQSKTTKPEKSAPAQQNAAQKPSQKHTSLGSLPKVSEGGSSRAQAGPSNPSKASQPCDVKKKKKKPEIRIVDGFVMTIAESEDEGDIVDDKSDEDEELDSPELFFGDLASGDEAVSDKEEEDDQAKGWTRAAHEMANLPRGDAEKAQVTLADKIRRRQQLREQALLRAESDTDDDDDDDDDDNDNDEDSGYKDRDTAETHEDSDGQEDDDDTAEEASSSSDSVSDSDEDEDQRPPSPVDEPYPQDLHRSAEDPLPSQHKDGAKQAKKPSGELSQKQKRGKQKEQQREEARRKEKDRAKAAFFLEEDDEDLELVQEAGSQLTFTDLHLSRALVKACMELGWGAPTEVQARCVPAVLSGRDVCGSAQTGSGKTAAFLLPVLERLLHADRRVPATRVLVLTPTRELAAQIDGMLSKLRRYCPPSIDSLLAVGGLSLREQAVAFRRRPTIVVGTPGRVLDLVRNEMSVSLEDVEVLVLDEADRLLDMGFRDELNELLHCCPSRTRQTLLFSATMTEAVTRLASVCQSRPVRVSVNDKYKAPRALSQEFVRVRQRHEGDREALLLSLCARTFHQQVVVFFNNKRHTHRMRVIFGLAGLRAAELHGNLTQAQRLDALRQFGEGEADYLLATDLAGRGLDLPAVRTVINYNLPGTLKQYMHRIGRTARAGRAGRAVSLVGEADRPLLKLILRKGEVQAKGREVPADSVAHWRARIEQMQPDLRAIAHEEHIERELRLAEQEAARAENLLHHEAEIFARPRRTWFQSSEEKEVAKKHSLRTALGRELRGEEGTAAEAKRAEEALEAEKAEKAAEKAKRRRERKKQSHEDAEAAELEREERGIKLAVRAAKRKAREAADRHSALPTERQIKRDEARERERAQQSVFEEEMKSAQIGARKKTRNTMRREREIDAKLNTVKKPIKKKGR
eukprot:CAMPEP_0177646114 /NCGR_PEP_ID=MMETSP0447-20121125/9601_1 /TAXON_ID=0 /ORGANISM="Stygamoeba regulata, Strain BSH-02190019" /LENGTH=955 /DNA_ID=CAMNT_0019148625 /DNA_START=156 /DNA_END=3019 /DNA_ORIENTATION=+